jgi:hypothetical protein
MASSNYGPYDVQSFVAAVDLDSKAGFFGKITASGLDLAGAGERADGVIVNVERSGAGATIGLMTTSGRKVPVAASAAISVGAQMGSAAGGKGATAASGDVINGIAVDSASADNDLVTCLFGYQGAKA